MNQIEKNNILHFIRDIRERKLDAFRGELKEPNLSNEFLVGKKQGIEVMCRAMEEMIRTL